MLANIFSSWGQVNVLSLQDGAASSYAAPAGRRPTLTHTHTKRLKWEQSGHWRRLRFLAQKRFSHSGLGAGFARLQPASHTDAHHRTQNRAGEEKDLCLCTAINFFVSQTDETASDKMLYSNLIAMDQSLHVFFSLPTSTNQWDGKFWILAYCSVPKLFPG